MYIKNSLVVFIRHLIVSKGSTSQVFVVYGFLQEVQIRGSQPSMSYPVNSHHLMFW